MVISGLFLFHILTASLMAWLASSPYLSSLHFGQGIWRFSGDSLIYHREAVTLIKTLNAGDWVSWWDSFPGHFHVKWIGLLYWLYGEGQPLLFELVNSITWVMSIVLIYLASRTLFNNTKIAVLAALFLFFPSLLLSSTQLLREPIYILGLCFITYGWVAIYQESSTWKGAVSIFLGYAIVIVVRSYLTPALIWVFLFATVVLIIRKKHARYSAIAMMSSILLVTYASDFSKIPAYGTAASAASMTRGAEYSVRVKKDGEVISLPEREYKGKLESPIIDERTGDIIRGARRNVIGINGESIGYVIPIVKANNNEISAMFVSTEKNNKIETATLDEQALIAGKIFSETRTKAKTKNHVFNRVAWRLDSMRFGFRNINVNAGSNIDAVVRYRDIWDMVAYFPRAVQISFLSPFPYHWFSSGRDTGKIGRLISGFETIIMYAVLIGFVFVLMRRFRIIEPLLPVIILSGIIIVLLGFVVPNVGAIFRMRQGPFIPFFIIGVYGLYLIFQQYKTKNSKND